MPFCSGRTDAVDGSGSEYLSPNLDGSASASQVKQRIKISGLTRREFVVLSARLRSPLQQMRLGYNGSYTSDPTLLSNLYFVSLLNDKWVKYDIPETGMTQYRAKGVDDRFMVPIDLLNVFEAEYLAIAQSYASDANLFHVEFAAAWTKLMNIDRFDGPVGNLCEQFNLNYN
jgi:catalase (peroxidase I)